MGKTNGLSVNIGGLPQIARNVGMLAQKFPQWLTQANTTTATEVKAQAQRNLMDIDAYDTGETHKSFEIVKVVGGLGVVVTNTAKQAPFIEFGTSPHFPPLEAIRAWCIRKGIDPGAAYPIAHAISLRGTPERPYLKPAYESQKKPHIDRIRSICWLGMRGFLKPVGR